MVLITIPVTGCFWLHQKLVGRGRGFDGFGNVGYKRVQGDEFDISGFMSGNEESLTDFVDEAEHDDYAPRVYDGTAVDDSYLRRQDAKVSTVSGGARAATQEVPRLQAPGGSGPHGGAQHFDMADGEDDLL